MNELTENFTEWIQEHKEECIKRVMQEEKCYISDITIESRHDGDVILVNDKPIYKIDKPKFNEEVNSFTIESYRI